MLDLCMVGIQQVIFTKFVFGRDIFTCTLYKKVKDTKYPAPDLVRRVVKRAYYICSHIHVQICTCQVGFDQFPDLWLVGYGLDDNGTKRGWPHVYGVPKVGP